MNNISLLIRYDEKWQSPNDCHNNINNNEMKFFLDLLSYFSCFLLRITDNL